MKWLYDRLQKEFELELRQQRDYCEKRVAVLGYAFPQLVPSFLTCDY